MGKIKLCDCTLSVGGSVISWDFGNSRTSVMRNLAESGADVVELGVLRDSGYRKGHTDYYATSIIKDCPPKRSNRFSLLVDTAKPFTTEYIEPASKSCIDLFRVVLWEDAVDEGLRCCKVLKEKGYEVSVLLVNCGQYSPQKFSKMAELAVQIDPVSIYVDDCYGMLYAEQIIEELHLLDEMLTPQVAIGYSGANSLQQVNVAARSIICDQKFKHDCILDVSAHGFAPQAGMLAVETVLDLLPKADAAKYNRTNYQAVYENFLKVITSMVIYGWIPIYEQAALSGCAPEYAFYYKYIMGVTEEEILQVFSHIPEEKRLHFLDSCAKEAIRLYRENFWMHKFCVIVPTANRPNDIDFYLDVISKYHDDIGIDLIIYDSSSDDKTQRVVEKYQKWGRRHIRYCRYTSVFDGVSLDAKVMEAYRVFSEEYEYIWMIRDGLIANIAAIYSKLYQAVNDRNDLTIIYNKFQDWKNIGEKLYTADNLTELFRDHCRHMTILGSTILSSSFLKRVLENIPLDQEKNYGMWQPISFFQYLPMCQFRAESIVIDTFIPNKFATATSFWNKSGNALWQWAERWYTMITMLPNVYDSGKEEVCHIEMADFHPFNPAQLIIMRASGSLTFKKWKKNRHYLEQVSNISEWKYQCVCIIPRWVCRAYLKNRFSLFSCVIRKFKNLAVKLYHVVHPPVLPAPIPLIDDFESKDGTPVVRFAPKQLCIVIPTANRAEALLEVLQKSARQYEDYGISLIIVDSSSDDSTEQAVKKLATKEHLQNIAYRRYFGEQDPRSLDPKVISIYHDVCDEYEYVWVLRDRLVIRMDICAYELKRQMQKGCEIFSIHNATDDYYHVGNKEYTEPEELFREQFIPMTVLGNTIIQGRLMRCILKEVPLDQTTNYGLWQPVAFFQYFAKNLKIKAYALSGSIFLYHKSALNGSFWMKQILWQWAERWCTILECLSSEVYGASKAAVVREWYNRYSLLSVPYLLAARSQKSLTVSSVKDNEKFLPYVSTVPLEMIYRIARYPRCVAVLASKTYGRRMWRKIREAYDDSLLGKIE